MVKQTPILWTVVIILGVFHCRGLADFSPKVVIDGYRVSSTLNSPATLPLGTTLILVCRLSGIPHGQQTTYTWTCPNTPCQQTGYAGRKINNNIIAINITSTSDGGTYNCTVTVGGMEASQQFQFKVKGGLVVHSYGRLIFHERVITDRHQLQPPNNDTGDGRIECAVSRGEARLPYSRYKVSNADSQKATRVIPAGDFRNFVNIEGSCTSDKHYHYLFLSDATLHSVTITGTSSTANSITVNIGTIPDGIHRVIIGYHRLDLGQPVVGEYINNHIRKRRNIITFSSLVPGAKYRITAWGLGGGRDRRRSRSPAVMEVTTSQKISSNSRQLTITRVFQHGIELNWIPPRETNGDIQHYIIKYTTQNGTEQEINTTGNTNYYNLTGLERGQTYNNITVVAVNSAGSGGGSGAIASYKHNTTESTDTTTPRGSGLGQSIGAAAVVILLLVGVLVLIISTIGLVRRREKRSRTAHQKQSLHNSGVQEGAQQAHNNCSKQTDTEESNNHTKEGYYEEVEAEDLPQVGVYSDYMTPSVSSDDLKRVVTDISAPDNITEWPHVESDMKCDSEKDNYGKYRNLQHSDLLYVEVDVTSKTDNQIAKTSQQTANVLYAEVDMANKKHEEIEKTSQQKANDYTVVTASYSILKIQDKEVSTTQPSPSANTEGLYAEVDKMQKKKNRVEK